MMQKNSVPTLLKCCSKFSDISIFFKRNLSNTKVTDSTLFCSLKTQLRKSADDLLPPAYGQPTPNTHPHLLANGEILPSIRLPELQNRRWKLLESIQNHCFNMEKCSKNHTVRVDLIKTCNLFLQYGAVTSAVTKHMRLSEHF
jgi:hypothetical protein